ncbi:MAG: hypothetical protein R3C19_01005 [Planctomycetaceae bacterium]
MTPAAEHSISSKVRVAVIGNATPSVFRPVTELLGNRTGTVDPSEFPTLTSFLSHIQHSTADVDIVVVLQSWSDEFSAFEVDALIGRTLSSRVLCCYGPWCESDGRNHHIWPEAVRVPARLARAALVAEIDACRRRDPALPVTAARDEVFFHRSRFPDSPASAAAGATLNAVVISHDRVLAETQRQLLNEFGLRASVQMPSAEADTAGIATSLTGPIHLVVHDLDPWSDTMLAPLQSALTRYPAAIHLGIASMPETVILPDVVDRNLGSILPKLDPVNGLLFQVRQMLNS